MVRLKGIQNAVLNEWLGGTQSTISMVLARNVLSSHFNAPRGITVDKNDMICVSDSAKSHLQICLAIESDYRATCM